MRENRSLLLAGWVLVLPACSGGGGGKLLPDAPTGLTASKGVSEEAVIVEWDAARAADTYRVFRDGELIAEISGLVFEDTGASPGGTPAPPSGVSASDGASADSVSVSWEVAAASPGAAHEYLVQAVNADGAGSPSSTDTGFRAAYPVLEYEVHRDGTLLTTVTAVTSFEDETAIDSGAPAAPGMVSASDAAASDKVMLTWSAPTSSSAAPHSYAVRGLNPIGSGPLSTADEGFRAPLPIVSYDIYRDGTLVSGTAALSFEDLTATPAAPGAPATVSASDAQFSDKVTVSWTAPSSTAGTTHLYAVRAVNAAGAGTLSATDSGSRAPQPTEGFDVFRDGTLIATVGNTATSLDDTAATAGGAPATPSNASASDATFSDKVVLTWSAPTVPPGASHTYGVRAFNAAGAGTTATDTGRRAGQPVQGFEVFRDSALIATVGSTATLYDDAFATAGGPPTAPSGVSASDGTFMDKVGVSWSAPTVPSGTSHAYAVRAFNLSGAGTSATDNGRRGGQSIQGFEIFRDGTLISTLGASATSHEDTGANAGGVPATPPGFTATDGTFADRVVLSWNAPSVPAGTAHSYAIRAFNAAGAGSSGTDSGQRSASPGLAYSLFRDGVALAISTNLSFADTTAGAPGAPLAPGSFAASDSTFPNKVQLTWNAAVTPGGASHTYSIRATNVAGSSVISGGNAGFRGPLPVDTYSIFRDGVPLAETMTPNFDDTTATSGGTSGSPVDLAATDGSLSDRIRLTWLSAIASGGPSHGYSLQATNAAGTSPVALDFGSRGAEPVTRYEISTDQIAWSDLGLVLTADDFGAPAGTLRQGSASASDGLSALHVLAEVTGVGPNPASNTRYYVRGVNSQGPGTSSSDTGYRGVGTVSFQWERSAGDSDSNYSAVIGATSVTFPDDASPANATGRYYRVVTSAPFAASSVISSVDRGFRSYLPLPTKNVRQDLWVPNGQVQALAQTNGVLYFAGEFTQVGPPTGTFVAINESTGLRAAGGPLVSGQVYRAISDGVGGWFIAGDLRAVNGIARSRLARILANGSLDLQFNPTIDNGILALAVDGGMLYIGGGFTTVNGQVRNRVAALDIATGALTSWNPNANATVSSLLLDGNELIVGGEFTTIGGQSRSRLAEISKSTGNASSWNPNVNSSVSDLVKANGQLYAAGAFTNVGAYVRNRLVAFDEFGEVTAWNPSANSFVDSISVAGTTVYAGGSFTTIGSAPRNRIAAIDSTTGLATPWDPNALDGSVHRIIASGGVVYAGGAFKTIGGQVQKHLAALDVVTGAAITWPNASGPVYALAAQGEKIYVGGDFSSVGAIDRDHFAALDLATGLPTTWNPGISRLIGQPAVTEMVVRNGVVYVSGIFDFAGGQSRTNLAGINAATGLATSWTTTLGPNEFVRALTLGDGVIYVGGAFTTIGGQPRQSFAALDLETGSVTSFQANANGVVNSIDLIDGTLWVTGSFSNIGGTNRNNIAALNPTTGAVSSIPGNLGNFGFSISGEIHTVAVHSGVMYLAGEFSVGSPAVRRNFAAFTIASSPFITGWNPSTDFLVNDARAHGGILYVVGAFSTVNGQSRQRIAAFDLGSATSENDGLLSWNPATSSNVTEVLPVADGVYIGGFYHSVEGLPQVHLTSFEPY